MAGAAALEVPQMAASVRRARTCVKFADVPYLTPHQVAGPLPYLRPAKPSRSSSHDVVKARRALPVTALPRAGTTSKPLTLTFALGRQFNSTPPVPRMASPSSSSSCTGQCARTKKPTRKKRLPTSPSRSPSRPSPLTTREALWTAPLQERRRPRTHPATRWWSKGSRRRRSRAASRLASCSSAL